MKLFILAVLACGLALSPELAEATATTHIWSPSTDVQAFNLWHITSDFYLPTKLDRLPDGTTQRLPAVTNLGLTVGILPFEKVQAEVGADHKSGYGALDSYPMYFNAKVGMPEKAFGKYFPAIAVGMFDHGHKDKLTNFDVAYGKVARTFGPVGRISVGYFAGNKDLLLDSKGEKANSGILAAWERTMPEISDKLWLCVDYMGGKSSYGTLNFGFSWKVCDAMSFIVAYDMFNDRNLVGVEDYLTVQADIDLSFCRKKE
jgi:hypothetical protein